MSSKDRKSRKASSKSSKSSSSKSDKSSSSSSKRSAKSSGRSKSASRSPARTASPNRGGDSEPKPSVLPNEILAAVSAAKKRDKSDKHGYNAFRFDLSRIRTHNGEKGKTRYIPFEVNVNDEWRPMCIRFENLKTKGKIPPPEDTKKRQYGLTLLYYASSTFDQKNKKGEVIATQEYGKAVAVACQAFQYHAHGMLKRKEISNKNKKIIPFVQFDRQDPDNPDDDEARIPVDDPLIRVKLAYDDKGEFTIAQGIRDIRKKMSTKERKKSPNTMPYHLATVVNEDGEEEPLTAENVHLFLRYGAPTFGVHDLSQMCLSQSGVSVPTGFALLAAKQPTSTRREATTHFDQDVMDGWGDAESSEPEEDEEEGSAEEKDEGDYGDFDDALASGDEEGSADGSGSGDEEGSGEGSDLDAAMSDDESGSGDESE